MLTPGEKLYIPFLLFSVIRCQSCPFTFGAASQTTLISQSSVVQTYLRKGNTNHWRLAAQHQGPCTIPWKGIRVKSEIWVFRIGLTTDSVTIAKQRQVKVLYWLQYLTDIDEIASKTSTHISYVFLIQLTMSMTFPILNTFTYTANIQALNTYQW